jgi:predicted Zn-dependent peptidase
VDSVGGMLDAFTSKEMVCFNTKVLDEHLAKAFDVIADMVLEPKFAEDEIEREKSVILEEIRMTQDNPEDLVHELFTQNFWYPHALGKPILGTPETVGAFSRATLRSWFQERYSPNNMVITAAGHLSHAQLLDLVAERFADRPAGNPRTPESVPVAAPHITVRTKHELEQVHLCLGVSSLPMTDRRRFGVSLLSNVLGGGMSSRLFQNIRERKGLAYSIFSELNSYRDAGVLSVYAGTSLETVSQLVRCVLDEFRRMKDEPLPEEELRRAKDHLKGATLLALEGTGQRMNSLARYHIYFDRHYTAQELIAMLEEVTAADVQRLAQEFFQSDRIAASVVGNLNGFQLTRDQLVL